MNHAKKIIVNNFANKDKLEEKSKASPSKSDLKIVDSNFEKMEYEKFKKLISEKLKDPKLAKKAALIISEMLNKK